MEEVSLKELGTRIKAARKVKNSTQDEVAESIGVSKGTVSQWERGVKQPGILNILSLCTFLHISLDELLDLQKQQPLNIEFTAKEREILLSMIEECEQETELSRLPHKLHALSQYLKAFLSRAQSTS